MVIFSKNDAGKFDEKNEIKFGKDEDELKNGSDEEHVRRYGHTKKLVFEDGKPKCENCEGPEQELENLIINNPDIVPVKEFSADSSKFIPIAKQIDIPDHGRLDILGIDNVGNLYIAECKITTINTDKKSIRGQISDYIAGLYAKRENWDFFCRSIKKANSSPTDDIRKLSFVNMELEDIIKNNPDIDDYENVLKNIKKNYQAGKYFLFFAVDHITTQLRETVDFHNRAIDAKDRYPMYALEIKKYSGKNNDQFISTQLYPFNSEELRIRTESSTRFPNTREKWEAEFADTELSNKTEIEEFKNKITKLVDDDGGFFYYGTGDRPILGPRFNSSSKRSAINLGPDGKLKVAFGMLKTDYPILYEELKKRFIELDFIKEYYAKPEHQKTDWQGNPFISTIWLPYRDKIVSILEDVLVK